MPTILEVNQKRKDILELIDSEISRVESKLRLLGDPKFSEKQEEYNQHATVDAEFKKLKEEHKSTTKSLIALDKQLATLQSQRSQLTHKLNEAQSKSRDSWEQELSDLEAAFKAAEGKKEPTGAISGRIAVVKEYIRLLNHLDEERANLKDIEFQLTHAKEDHRETKEKLTDNEKRQAELPPIDKAAQLTLKQKLDFAKEEEAYKKDLNVYKQRLKVLKASLLIPGEEGYDANQSDLPKIENALKNQSAEDAKTFQENLQKNALTELEKASTFKDKTFKHAYAKPTEEINVLLPKVNGSPALKIELLGRISAAIKDVLAIKDLDRRQQQTADATINRLNGIKAAIEADNNSTAFEDSVVEVNAAIAMLDEYGKRNDKINQLNQEAHNAKVKKELEAFYAARAEALASSNKYTERKAAASTPFPGAIPPPPGGGVAIHGTGNNPSAADLAKLDDASQKILREFNDKGRYGPKNEGAARGNGGVYAESHSLQSVALAVTIYFLQNPGGEAIIQDGYPRARNHAAAVAFNLKAKYARIVDPDDTGKLWNEIFELNKKLDTFGQSYSSFSKLILQILKTAAIDNQKKQSMINLIMTALDANNAQTVIQELNKNPGIFGDDNVLLDDNPANGILGAKSFVKKALAETLVKDAANVKTESVIKAYDEIAQKNALINAFTENRDAHAPHMKDWQVREYNAFIEKARDVVAPPVVPPAPRV